MNKRLKLDDLASKDFFMLEMGVKIFGQQLSMNKRRQVFDLTSKSFFMMQKNQIEQVWAFVAQCFWPLMSVFGWVPTN